MLPLLLATALQSAPLPAVTLRHGPAPEAVGLSHDDESSPEGPGSLAVDADGRLWVLDAVKRRVAVLGKDGALEASIPLPSDTIEDLALLPTGELALLDRQVARTVYIVAENGAVLATAAVEGPGVSDGGEVTALLADEAGVWLEVLHGAQVRALDAGLRPDQARATRVGLPVRGRDAKEARFLRLRKVGDHAQVLLFDAAGTLREDSAVAFSSLLELSGLVVGGETLWIAGHELVQAAPGARPTRDAIVVVRLERSKDGRYAERGRTSMKASPEFVPLKQLVASTHGVAHLFVDTTAPRGATAVEVQSW
ncbi:MAG: hypothetical protein IT382_25280 [Deltaproteobacteria bacterium]|nr:hypothetical protein [Deltaproteobacteria bacterium]